jgi:hypothetical protein
VLPVALLTLAVVVSPVVVVFVLAAAFVVIVIVVVAIYHPPGWLLPCYLSLCAAVSLFANSLIAPPSL